MLASYLSATRALLQNPAAPTSLYSDAFLTAQINTARGQLAGESECLRVMGTLALVAGTKVYNFSAINTSGVAGIQGVLNARTLWYLVGSGQKWFRPRPFEYFGLYYLNSAAPITGAPQVWSQYAQGASGSLYIWPTPDIAYTTNADCVCYPIPLVDDTTVEAIPPLWTDAIPYYAAYVSLISAQTGERLGYAEKMFELYKQFVQRARGASTPSVLPTMYPQNPSPVMSNTLGIQSGRGA